MKKILFSLLAIAAIASCAKTEPVYVEDNSEIKLAPVTTHVTKAVPGAIESTKYPDTEHFTVIGYWNAAGAGSTFETGTTYLDAVDFAKDGDYWAGSKESYYWPKNGSLRFATYSPTEIKATSMEHTLSTDTWVATDYVQTNDTEYTVDFMVAQTPPSYTAQTATEKVSVVFEHALSWISFKIKAQDEAAEDAFVVKSITVDNVYTKGTMTAEYPAKDWEVSGVDADKKPYVVTTTAPALDVEPVEVVNNGVLVIPQATTTVTVTFTQNTLKDEKGNLIDQSLTIPLVLDVEHTPWEAGKHYIYTLIFGLDEILINPSVEEWEDVEVNDVPATDEVVYTASELEAAINNGGMVRLGADVELVGSYNLKNDLNIDLAGFTLTADVTNSILFRVENGASLTIGRGAIEANGYIASANEGGVVTVNAGDYHAVSPTLFQANGGKVYITGGNFSNESATYGATYLLNHIDGKKNDGLIEVTGGSFTGFNPADNNAENPQMSFVKDGYNVTAVGDVYTVTAADENVTLAADTEVEATYNVAGAVLDGAGKEITVEEGTADFVTGGAFRLIELSGDSTVKNLTIDGNNASYDGYGVRAIFLVGAGVYNIDNVEIYNVTYTLNDDAAEKTLNVTNSVFEGWTSYNPKTTANFTNVKFECGPTQKTFRPHGNTVVTDCEFEKDFVIELDKLVEAGNTIKFDNCKYNGTVITADNYTEFVKNGNLENILF